MNQKLETHLSELRAELEAAEAAEFAHPLPCNGAQAVARARRVSLARAFYARALGAKAYNDGLSREANPYKQDHHALSPYTEWDRAWFLQSLLING